MTETVNAVDPVVVLDPPVVVFDLGGVLVSPTDQVDHLAEALGVSPDEARDAYWARDAYDAGCSELDYWGPIFERFGVPLTPELAEDLGWYDARAWGRIRPEVLAILEELHEAGVHVAVLSNAPVKMAAVLEEAPWRSLYSELFVSGLLGMVKPHREIYDAVAEGLGVPAGRIHFIDDRQPNVDGAVAAGWNAELWTSDEDTREWLVGLGVLAAR